MIKSRIGRWAVLPGVAMLLIAAGAVAKDGDRFKRLDVNGDGVISMADLLAVSDRRVKLMDGNGDGVITRAELMAYLQQRATRRTAKRFARLDRNGDGKISRAEAGEAGWQRIARSDADGDKAVTRRELSAHMAGRAKRWQVRIFQRFDSNKDGRISRGERIAVTTARFKRLDSNADGNISRTEFGDALLRWRKKRSR
jgi:Ca2+-binding EF-hand superfamily protein